MLIHEEEFEIKKRMQHVPCNIIIRFSEHANTGAEGTGLPNTILFIDLEPYPTSGKTCRIVDSADAKWR